MKKQASNNIGFAACALAIRSASNEVQLFPDGPFKARDGRPLEVDHWIMNGDIANRLIAEAAARNTPYLIDYEHQTLYAEENGQPAPRAAKFSKLEWRSGDGLYAVDVVWTKRAQEYIDGDEYEFISPVFPYSKTTGEVLGLYHAALTNDPAIDGMAGVAAARFTHSGSKPNKEDFIMNDALLALLGLKKDASDEDINNAVAALKARLDVVGGVRDALGIADDADPVAAVAALKTSVGTETEPDPAQFVPIGVVKDLQGQVAALSTQVNTKAVDDMIDLAMSEGKLLPAQEDWARALGQKDIASLKSYIESAQPVAALKGGQTGGKGPGGSDDGELSDEALAVCKQMGLTVEEYKAANA